MLENLKEQVFRPFLWACNNTDSEKSGWAWTIFWIYIAGGAAYYISLDLLGLREIPISRRRQTHLTEFTRNEVRYKGDTEKTSNTDFIPAHRVDN